MRSSFVAMMKSFSCSPLIFLVCKETVACSQPEADIRIMASGFRELANLLDKGRALSEITKPEAPLDAVGVPPPVASPASVVERVGFFIE